MWHPVDLHHLRCQGLAREEEVGIGEDGKAVPGEFPEKRRADQLKKFGGANRIRLCGAEKVKKLL
jgi:hypothetical protein